MKRVCTLFLLLLLACICHAQTGDTVSTEGVAAPAKQTTKGPYTITGKVQDINTGEGLPFATVFFPHTSQGTAADVDGNFVLKVEKLPKDTLKVEAVGYKPTVRFLNKTTHNYEFVIEMERTITSLNEVVFYAGEDPAVLLLRAIIKRKPLNNPDRLDNYSYESYNKMEADLQRMSRTQFNKIPLLRSYSFIFDNIDSTSESQPYLPLYMTETLSDVYYQRDPKKQKEQIKASLIKGVNNENVVRYLGGLYQKVNIYDNYLPVLNKKFVSPIGDEALLFYKFKIKDTQMVHGHKVIRVQFKPKRPVENCFNGEFWVVDSVLAIERVSMDISKEANINWVDKISYFQEFTPIGDSVWFCTKDKLVVNFTFYESKKIPGLIGRKTTTYHNIRLNDTGMKHTLEAPEMAADVSVQDSAKQQSDEWWAKNRPDSLTKNEIAINKMVDTINNMPLTRYYKNFITFMVSGVKDFGPIQLGPYYTAYSRNPVEGHRFRLSAGSSRLLKDAHITAYVAYGTRDERFKYGGTALWLLQRQPRMYLYGYFAHDIHQRLNYYDKTGGGDNIFAAMVRKPGIPWKLAFANDQRLEWYKEYFNGFSHKLMLTHRDFTPYHPTKRLPRVASLPTDNVFVNKDGMPSGTATNSEVGVDFRYAYKEKYIEGPYKRITLKSRWPILNVEAAAGIKNVLNSAYDYQRIRITLSETINIPPIGKLSYNVFCGKYYGTLPYALLEMHPGNEAYYYNRFAFEMMNNYEFISDRFAGFMIDHNVGGGIFNRIPVVKRWKLRQFWTAKGVIGELNDANTRLNMGKGYPFKTLEGHPYLELGTGISNILELFRIDFVWRVTPKPAPFERHSKYFGIFGSVRFDF